MSNSSFVVYVDESGDEGFRFGKGSSTWFVLSAIVTRKATDLETVKLVDKVREILGKPPKVPLHFRRLKHEQRLPYVAEIARAKLRTVSILVHKPSILEPEKFAGGYHLYFFAVRCLLERVSWLCRDQRRADDGTDGSADVVFSTRSGMSYEEMKEDLERLRRQSEVTDVDIDWNVVKTSQICAYSPGKRMGLQIADAVATASFFALEPRLEFTEDRYVRMLRPVVYHHHGHHLGYGLKFWPREVERTLKNEDKLLWLREFQ